MGFEIGVLGKAYGSGGYQGGGHGDISDIMAGHGRSQQVTLRTASGSIERAIWNHAVFLNNISYWQVIVH